MIDPVIIACCFLLIAMASGACCYFIGHYFGFEAGEIAGENKERRQSTVRVINAKKLGAQTGRVVGMIEAERQFQRQISTTAVIEKLTT